MQLAPHSCAGSHQPSGSTAAPRETGPASAWPFGQEHRRQPAFGLPVLVCPRPTSWGADSHLASQPLALVPPSRTPQLTAGAARGSHPHILLHLEQSQALWPQSPGRSPRPRPLLAHTPRSRRAPLASARTPGLGRAPLPPSHHKTWSHWVKPQKKRRLPDGGRHPKKVTGVRYSPGPVQPPPGRRWAGGPAGPPLPRAPAVLTKPRHGPSCTGPQGPWGTHSREKRVPRTVLLGSGEGPPLASGALLAQCWGALPSRDTLGAGRGQRRPAAPLALLLKTWCLF